MVFFFRKITNPQLIGTISSSAGRIFAIMSESLKSDQPLRIKLVFLQIDKIAAEIIWD